jgi:hypothetical protein
MSTSTRTTVVSLVALSWLAAGCSDSSKKVDLGGGCLLNSDCNSPLSCTFGKCHTACVETRDCPLGQACVQTPGGGVCQFPADSDCQSSGGVCPAGQVCATDQRCRKICQTAADCLAGQACSTSGACADSQDLDGTGQIVESGVGVACVTSANCNSSLTCAMNRCHYLCQGTNLCPSGQSCVNTGSGPVCQLPVEALCDGSVPCPGGLVCAVDYRCRAGCGSDSDCTPGQKCAGGVCADSSDLNPGGQLPPKSPPVISRDAGLADAPVADAVSADVPVVSPADVPLEVYSAEAGLPDTREAATGEAGGGVDSAGGADGGAVGGGGGAGGRGGAGGASGTGGSKGTGGTVATGGTPAAGGTGTGGSTTDAGPGGGSDVLTGCGAPSTATRYFCDDFENGLAKWTVSGQDWGPATTSARSDVTSLAASPNGNYLNGQNAAATIAGTIDLAIARAPILTFWQTLALYCAPNTNYCLQNGVPWCRTTDQGDYAYVEASKDGGLKWDVLAKLTNKDNMPNWSQQVLSLASYVGAPVRIRFRLTDNSGGAASTDAGWFIDDVEVRELDASAGPPDPLSGGCTAGTANRYFCDGFEAGLGNWVVSGKDWNTVAVSDSVSGTHVLTDSPNGSYLLGQIATARLVGSVDLRSSTAPVLAFWYRLALAKSSCYPGPDGVYVEASSDAGLTWSRLATPGANANTTTWIHQLVDLAPYVGKQAMIRFQLWDNVVSTADIGDGWYLDDVEVRELAATASPPNSDGGCGPATTTRYFCDSFEAGADNWYLSRALGGRDWNLTTNTAAVTGTHALTDSPDGNYLSGTNSSAGLIGNVDLTAASAPVITFWHKLALASGDATYLDVSTDGGLTWTQLASFGSANSTSTWAQQMYDLSKHAGHWLTLRFRFADDGNGKQADGWYIDDVEIRENL